MSDLAVKCFPAIDRKSPNEASRNKCVVAVLVFHSIDDLTARIDESRNAGVRSANHRNPIFNRSELGGLKVLIGGRALSKPRVVRNHDQYVRSFFYRLSRKKGKGILKTN